MSVDAENGDVPLVVSVAVATIMSPTARPESAGSVMVTGVGLLAPLLSGVNVLI